MNFGNNIEKLGFEHSGWLKVATSENITYMGKPSTADALDDEPVWLVKRIEHHSTAGKDGFQYVTTKYSKHNVKWSERESLSYKYFWE